MRRATQGATQAQRAFAQALGITISPVSTANEAKNLLEQAVPATVTRLLEEAGIRPGCIVGVGPARSHLLVFVERRPKGENVVYRLDTGKPNTGQLFRIEEGKAICTAVLLYQPPPGFVHRLVIFHALSTALVAKCVRRDKIERLREEIATSLGREEKMEHPDYGPFWNKEAAMGKIPIILEKDR